MNKQKCKDCIHQRITYSGWNYCGGSQCEVDVREDEINRFQEWFLKTKQYCDYPEDIEWVMEKYREYIKGNQELNVH